MAKSLINQCTTDEVGQPSGFKLQELARLSHNSIQECQYIEELLLKKLGKNKPLVKLKVLRVIKFLCLEGRDQFRLDLHNHTDEVRKCSQYRGTPDPLYGDRHYQQVRQAAKDTMTAIFSQPADRNRTRAKIHGMGGGSRSGGQPPPPSDPPPGRGGGYSVGTYGGRSYDSGGMGGMGSGSKYPGFGNTPSYNEPEPKGIFGRISGAVTSTLSRNTGTNANQHDFHPEPHENPPPYNPGEPRQKESFTDPYALPSTFKKTKPRKKKRTKKTRRSTSGQGNRRRIPGDWGKSESEEEEEEEVEEEEEEVEPPSRGHHRRPSGPYGAERTTESRRRPQKAQELGRYERKVVDEITSMGRGAPPQMELNKFVQNFKSLDHETICNLLLEKLDDQKNSVKLRTLVILDELLKSDLSDEVKDFMMDDAEDVLLELTNANHRQIRNRATTLAIRLGFKEREQTRAVRARSRSNPRGRPEEPEEPLEEEEEEEDEVDDDDLIDWDATQTTTSVKTPSAAEPPLDLFSQMSLHETPAAGQQPANTGAPQQERKELHPMDDFLINQLHVETQSAPKKVEAPIFDPLDSGFAATASQQSAPAQPVASSSGGVFVQTQVSQPQPSQQPMFVPQMQQMQQMNPVAQPQQGSILANLMQPSGQLAQGVAAPAGPQSSFSFLQENSQPQQQQQQQQQLMFQQQPQPQMVPASGHSNVQFVVRAQQAAPKSIPQQQQPQQHIAPHQAGGYVDPFANTQGGHGGAVPRPAHNPYQQQNDAFLFVNDMLKG